MIATLLAQLRQLGGYFHGNTLKILNATKKVGTTNCILKIVEGDSI